jgi:arylsulfatase A
MKNTTWSLLVAVCALCLLVACTADETSDSEPTSPNFLVILVDDLGYGDLGSFGSTVIQTPNIDGLASEGLLLTDFYASAPMCSPSRAGLLTGRVPYRYGVYDWIPPGHDMHLPASEVTIASLLREAGYATAIHGKWHLNGKFNSPEQPQPDDQGFDYWFAVQYSQPHLDPKDFVRNGVPVETVGYAAQIVADDAVRWLRESRGNGKPFFQFVNFLEPHEPIMSPPELVSQYAEHGIKAEYYANVTNLDEAIGRILTALDELDLADDTLVLFTSDNGPAQYTPDGYFNKSHGSAGPLQGYKRHMFEGGIRVPAVVRWPGHTRAGETSSEPLSNVDILPTLAAIAGVSTPDDRVIDGSDMTPVFRGESIDRSVPLHWHFYDPWGGPQSVLRQGDWMIGASWDVGDFHPFKAYYDMAEAAIIQNSKLAEFELYNLVDDIHQDHNLAEEYPARVEAMKTELIRLHDEVMTESRLQ